MTSQAHLFPPTHVPLCDIIRGTYPSAQRDIAWRLRQSFSHHVWHMWPVLTKWVFFAWTGLLFLTFVCSLYSPWATIRLLHHFGFVCALILAYSVCNFRAIDAKYVMFRVGWRKSLIKQHQQQNQHYFTVSTDVRQSRPIRYVRAFMLF